jgi:ketosteroid isomerase-like protein
VDVTDDDKLAVAAALAEATRARDTDAIAAMSASDAVVWHNFDDREGTIAEAGRTLRRLDRTVPDLAWTDVAVLPTSQGFVWQAVLTGTGPGGPFRAHTCQVVTLAEDARIVRMDEYLDTSQLAALAPPRATSAEAPPG